MKNILETLNLNESDLSVLSDEFDYGDLSQDEFQDSQNDLDDDDSTGYDYDGSW